MSNMGLQTFLVKILPPKWLRSIQEKVVQSKRLIQLMFKTVNEDTLLTISKRLALYTFKTASKRVPAYKKFLAEHNVDPKKIRTFQNFMALVPIMYKKDYLKKYPLDELCYGGNPHHRGLVNSSSGYTGKPVYFLLKEKENYLEEKCVGNWMAAQFKLSPSDLIVNCLMLGSWVGGIRSGNAGRYASMVVNVGPRVQEATEIIINLSKYYKRIVVSAYPPFVLSLIAALQEKKFDFKTKPFIFITGGEGFDEGFRQNVLQRTEGNSKIYSAYGSVETGIRVANETEETIMLRQMVLKNKDLCEKLFGRPYPPNLFQFDPTYVHVFTKKNEEGKQQLIYTTLSDKLIPVIKYNLKDEGGIYTQKELNALLKKYVNFEIKFTLPLPIIYVYGRSDSALSILSFSVYPQQIRDALLPYMDNVIEYKAEVVVSEELITYPLFHILAKDVSKIKIAEVEERLFKFLQTQYFPYEELILNGLAGKPVVKLYTTKNWPFEHYDPTKSPKHKPF
ncbi:MAG: phenylacetate--CoA ligase family protein [Candidatus Heimdallarchaeaceae archaeon]